NVEEHDVIDGELACKVLQLMDVTQAMVAQVLSRNVMHGHEHGNERLDLSFLYFFQMFRKSYIGDQAQRASKVYNKLSELFALNDQHMVLNIIVQKLASNLRNWASNETIISRSLQLFNDLASGYTSVKLLRKTETAQFILTHHTSDYFPFLDIPANIKGRSSYYAGLGRLLFAMDENQEMEFVEFVQPFAQRLDELSRVNDAASFRQRHIQVLLDGLFRDLRIGLMILLFRETSKVLTTYGQLLLSRNVDESRKWSDKYKGIMLCFNILRWSLVGKYVNFGVFGLYNDPALDNALNVCYQLILSLPLKDVMVFPKLSQVLPFIMSRLLELVFFEDNPVQWSLTRPLLPLILLGKEFFQFYIAKVIQNQLPERQEAVNKMLNALMEGIEPNLLSKNRDRFTQQCLNFRRDVNNQLISLIAPKDLPEVWAPDTDRELEIDT
ncbi:Exportin 7, partial [Quaeritorhiza haematococci]